MVARIADVPAHVPPECVVDVDVYHMPGSERDFLCPWKALQDSSARSLFWTPRNGGHWIVTRGREIARIYADHQSFSSRVVMVPKDVCERFQLRPTTLDPPAHRPYRRLINSAMPATLTRGAEPKISELAAEAIESVRSRGSCEFISDVAAKLPAGVFLYLANLPAEDVDMLPPYAEHMVAIDGTITDARVMSSFSDYLRPHVIDRQRHPGDDLISQIATGAVDGRTLSVEEAVDVTTAVMTGGIDTVISTLGLIMAFLATNPDHRRRLAADPTSLRPAVAEMLRRFPTMTKARLLTRDQEIEGVTMKAGDVVILPPLHGLDEQEFSDPMTIDFDRKPAPNLTFGHGVHRCPGASLTHAELEITIREWLARIPEFEMDPLCPIVMQGGVLGAVLKLGLKWT